MLVLECVEAKVEVVLVGDCVMCRMLYGWHDVVACVSELLTRCASVTILSGAYRWVRYSWRWWHGLCWAMT